MLQKAQKGWNKIEWVNTNLKWSGFMIGILGRKSSLLVIRSSENQFLYLSLYIVFHCYNHHTQSLLV